MRYLILLVFIPPVLLGVGGAVFTQRKLHTMWQIRGWTPGATIEVKRVRETWMDDRPTYWLSFTDDDVSPRGRDRINLPLEVWQRFEADDPIEIVYLPAYPTPYHRDGIYASDGNIAFDVALLVLECALALGAILMAAIAYRFLKRRPAVLNRQTGGGLRRP